MNIEELKKRKQELGYSNRLLAEESGVPLGTVQKIFGGETKAPRKQTLEALTQVLFRKENVYPTSASAQPAVLHDARAALPRDARIARPRDARTAYLYDIQSDLLSDAQPALLREAQAAYRIPEKHPGDFTKEDYYQLPDDVRAELIDGVFYDMASPTRIHQGILGGLHIQLDACVQKHAGECFIYMAPSDVELGNKTVVQPDLYIHCHPENETIEPLKVAPDFVVEIISPSNPGHDIWRKHELYFRYGVREYWIVDPRRKLVTVYRFETEELPITYTFEDTVPVGISHGECSVDFQKIYARVRHFYE